MKYQEVVQTIVDTPYPYHNSSEIHRAVARTLIHLGLIVAKEAKVSDRGDGKSGRIDLVAYHEDYVIAIEIDWKSPRKKSIFKLNQYEKDKQEVGKVHKLCLLRAQGKPFKKPEGITVIYLK